MSVVAPFQDPVFRPWLFRWHLVPDGAPILTRSSKLLPVRRADVPAMLKVARPCRMGILKPAFAAYAGSACRGL